MFSARSDMNTLASITEQAAAEEVSPLRDRLVQLEAENAELRARLLIL